MSLVVSWFSTHLIIYFSSPDLTDVMRRLWETLTKALLKSRHRAFTVLPMPTQPVLSLREAIRLIKHDLPLVGPCCCYHCPCPSGHGFQEDVLHHVPRTGGDTAAHSAREHPSCPSGRWM